MKILLIGTSGQVGWELAGMLGALGEVCGVDRDTVDFADAEAVRRAVRSTRPELIVNAAAYTAVDRAEAEPEAAMQINGVAPGVLAEEGLRLGALLIHYSTDYVFDGTKAAPYVEADVPNPLNAYGRSKLAGEQAIQRSGARHLILRTSWVYGPRGHNFVRTILRVARQQPELRVVEDQVGAPTFCRALAQVTVALAPKAISDPRLGGIYHTTNGGETSWYGFAREIVRLAGLSTTVHPIPSSQYPTPAARPQNSRLLNAKLLRDFGCALPHWRTSLEECMREVDGE